MKTNRIEESKTEYSIIGKETEEHFDNYNDADNFYRALPKEERETCQFFGKDWNKIEGEWQEGYVEIFAQPEKP